VPGVTFRKVLFWMHLTAGATAGILILIMCLTGVALTYERQINAWADRHGLPYQPPADGSPRLPVETLIARAQESVSGSVTTFGMYSDPDRPVEAALGREGVLFVNPYTGEVMRPGAAARASRAFFRTITDWHRWLGASGESRTRGKAVMDAANLVFFFILLSGVYLWFPRTLSWRQFRPALLFRTGLRGRARDFNWHNVIGVWCWAPLVAVVGTGVIISYPWASNLLYTLSGTQAPLQRRESQTARQAPRFNGLNAAWTAAERQVPGWKSIRLAAGGNPRASYVFTIDRGDGGQPQLRGTLTVDRASAEVRSWVPFAGQNTGQRLRSLARFTHTGEALGLAGQTAAGIATLGGALLVYTGLALAVRRYFAWLRRPLKAPTTGGRDSLAA
jgi:uncharacterized iron-regulated membrane protein